MSVAQDRYTGTCRNCGKDVWIQTRAQVADRVASKAAKWVRCGECSKITLCKRVQE